MGKWRGELGERRRWLLLLVVMLIPVLALAQEVLWEPVKTTLQKNLSNPWISAAMLLVVILASALLSQWLLEKRETRPEEVDSEWHREQRLRLLRRLSQSYTGFLEQSIRQTVRLELRLDRVPTKILQGGLTRILPVRRQEEQLPEGTSLLQVFDQAAGLYGDGVLVLGGPGAGKTTLLIELAEQLTARARADPQHPIPVYLPLSTWAARRTVLADWLVHQLDELYQVPRRLGRRWLETSQLLLLLDGLDEIADIAVRSTCAEEINQFNHRNPMPIVVCSRQVEYDALAVRLELDTAVALRPLDPQMILTYLRQAGPQTQAVLAAVEGDPDLRNLLQSPLLLSMLTFTYTDTFRREIPVTIGSPSQRRQQLIADYVNRRLELAQEQQDSSMKRDRRDYPVDRTLRWLSALAVNLTSQHESVLVLSRLRSDWLPSRWSRRLVRLCPVLVWGISYGIIDWVYYARIEPVLGLTESGSVSLVWILALPTFGLAVGLIYEMLLRLPYRLGVWIAFGLVVALLQLWREASHSNLEVPLASAISASASTVVYFLMAGEAATRLIAGELPLAERLSWSWKIARPLVTSRLGLGLVLGIVLGIALGGRGVFAELDVSNVALAGLAYGVVIGLIWGIGLGITGGLMVGSIPNQITPNEGLRRSVRYGLFMALGSMLIVALLLGALGLLLGASAPVVAGWILDWAPLIGVLWGLHSGLGAAVQQLLLRILLWRYHISPLRFVRWLNYVTGLRLLYWGFGGGYAFIHGTVQDYFSAAAPSWPGRT